MGWFNYYNLLEKYKGDLSQAEKSELDYAAYCNPDNPPDARRLAEQKWKENQSKTKDAKP